MKKGVVVVVWDWKAIRGDGGQSRMDQEAGAVDSGRELNGLCLLDSWGGKELQRRVEQRTRRGKLTWERVLVCEAEEMRERKRTQDLVV